MKKNPHSARAKLGHHARQRAQTDMIVHGWRGDEIVGCHAR